MMKKRYNNERLNYTCRAQEPKTSTIKMLTQF